MEKKQDFSGNTDHVILGLGLGCGGVTVMVKWGTAMLQVVWYMVTSVQHQRPWQRYALYWVPFLYFSILSL